MTRVDDAVATSAYNNGFEFKDGVKQANEYNYDSNGNFRVFVAPQNTETRPTAAENPAGRPSSGPNAQPKVAPM